MKAHKDNTKLKVEQVSWRKIKSNPYNQNLHPRMFDERGLNVRSHKKLKGSSVYDKPQDCFVNYDTEFVKAKIARLFQPLVDASFDTETILGYCREAIVEALNNVGQSNGSEV